MIPPSAGFPRAQDFTVKLRVWGQDQGKDWLNLNYLVSTPETRICWGWWTEPLDKIRRWTAADTPCGTPENPHHDSDQGWNILVWQQADEVYIAEGDGVWNEERDENTYERWFKVSRSQYDAAWTTALAQLRAP